MLACERCAPHDLRRTARTHLEALGVAPHIAERCLNHKLRGVVGIYNRHDYFEELKVRHADAAFIQFDAQLKRAHGGTVRRLSTSRQGANKQRWKDPEGSHVVITCAGLRRLSHRRICARLCHKNL